MEYPGKSSESFMNRRVSCNASILASLELMDRINVKLLLVFDADLFVGVLSIGDIQKAIISNFSLDTAISSILRKNFVFSRSGDSREEIMELMKLHRIECMPVVNKAGVLIDVYLWEDLFDNKTSAKIVDLNLPVIIMAGGEGTRLKPLTNIIPKPLIPIGELTIIETIMDKFCEVGCRKFFISVNYKAEMIRYYFSTLNHEKYQIEYIKEDMPLGTAGSLNLLKGKINSTFFVSNCDIIIEQDIDDILEYHRTYKNEITVVAALKNYNIPYGILNTSDGGKLTGLTEKPDLTFKINTGFYILEPNLLDEIPENKYYHITTLIEKLMHENRKVGVFPVSEKSWKDIGSWEEFQKILNY
jgi:dTDP-glucose pyrophosphorylase